MMSSTAAAELLGISNIADYSDSVNYAIYVSTIALEKIKAEVVNTPRAHTVQERVSRSAYMYSVSTNIPIVNSKELMKCLSNDMWKFTMFSKVPKKK